jgi:hypothetical protein
MQMTVQPSILDDGALLLMVETDDCQSHEQFWNGGGLKLAMQGIRSAIKRGEMPDSCVFRFFQSGGNGRDVEVELRRTDGTLVKSGGYKLH